MAVTSRTMLWMLCLLAAGAAVVTPASGSDPITTAGERQLTPNSYPIKNDVSTTLSSSAKAKTRTTEVQTYIPFEETGEDDGRGRSLLHNLGCHGRRCAARGSCRGACAHPYMHCQDSYNSLRDLQHEHVDVMLIPQVFY